MEQNNNPIAVDESNGKYRISFTDQNTRKVIVEEPKKRVPFSQLPVFDFSINGYDATFLSIVYPNPTITIHGGVKIGDDYYTVESNKYHPDQYYFCKWNGPSRTNYGFEKIQDQKQLSV